MLLVILSIASAAAFLYYGYETVFKVPPRGEYERYGMPRVRIFVGSMQLLGGLGLLFGLVEPVIGALAATGLVVMMLLGLAVRYRIHDAPRLMVPAASLAVLNLTILILHIA